MPRIRYLKPEFFTDSKLLALPPITRLLFEGLWVWADREGRLEDSPFDLKIRILPIDDCNIEELLRDLDAAGRIVRYEAEGLRLIEIPNFSKHQKPHRKEADSKLPPFDPGKDRLSPNKDRASRIGMGMGMGMGKGIGKGIGIKTSSPLSRGDAAKDPEIASAVASGQGLKAPGSGPGKQGGAVVGGADSRRRHAPKGKAAAFSVEALSERGKLAVVAIAESRKIVIKNMELVAIWEKTYPGLDLAAEIRAADAWAVSKGKRYKSYDKTITTWLEKRRTGGFTWKANGPAREKPQEGKYDAF